jgi:NhaB family Na+:H+ antiporter
MQDPAHQPPIFFLANGILSAISDNVFVATVYINEVAAAYEAGEISRELFDHLAVAINTGTNIPSVATPNGQALLNFLLALVSERWEPGEAEGSQYRSPPPPPVAEP